MQIVRILSVVASIGILIQSPQAGADTSGGLTPAEKAAGLQPDGTVNLSVYLGNRCAKDPQVMQYGNMLDAQVKNVNQLTAKEEILYNQLSATIDHEQMGSQITTGVEFSLLAIGASLLLPGAGTAATVSLLTTRALVGAAFGAVGTAIVVHESDALASDTKPGVSSPLAVTSEASSIDTAVTTGDFSAAMQDLGDTTQIYSQTFAQNHQDEEAARAKLDQSFSSSAAGEGFFGHSLNFLHYAINPEQAKSEYNGLLQAEATAQIGTLQNELDFLDTRLVGLRTYCQTSAVPGNPLARSSLAGESSGPSANAASDQVAVRKPAAQSNANGSDNGPAPAGATGAR